MIKFAMKKLPGFHLSSQWLEVEPLADAFYRGVERHAPYERLERLAQFDIDCAALR
jgi:hypothetical protein